MKHLAWILNDIMSVLGLVCVFANFKICYNIKSGMMPCFYHGEA